MNPRLIMRLLLVRFKEHMEYRIEWVFMFLTTLTAMLTGIIFWFMLSNGKGFNGWSYPELILLSTIGLLSREITYIIGFDPWIRRIMKKKLTVYMTKPVNLLGFLCVRHGDTTSLPGMLVSLVTIGLIPIVYHVNVDIPLFLVFFLLSVFIHIILFFTIFIVAIHWYDTAEELNGYIFNLLFIARNPIDSIKTGWLSVVLYPLLFVSVFPSHAFVGNFTVDHIQLTITFIIFSVIFYIEYLLWKHGLRNYESFGG